MSVKGFLDKVSESILNRFDVLAINAEGALIEQFTYSYPGNSVLQSSDIRYIKKVLPSELSIVEYEHLILTIVPTASFSMTRYKYYYSEEFEHHLLKCRSKELMLMAKEINNGYYLDKRGIWKDNGFGDSWCKVVNYSELGLKELDSNSQCYTLAKVITNVFNSQHPSWKPMKVEASKPTLYYFKTQETQTTEPSNPTPDLKEW